MNCEVRMTAQLRSEIEGARVLLPVLLPSVARSCCYDCTSLVFVLPFACVFLRPLVLFHSLPVPLELLFVIHCALKGAMRTL